MLLVPMPPPSKSEEDANEAPTQRDSSKSIGNLASEGEWARGTPSQLGKFQQSICFLPLVVILASAGIKPKECKHATGGM